MGVSVVNQFYEAEAECGNEEPGPAADEQWLPAFCFQLAKIGFEAHPGKRDRKQ